MVLGEKVDWDHHPQWVVLAAQLAADLTVALHDYQEADPVRAAGFREKLQAAYTTLHDLRAGEYLTGYGTKGHGNFIWQYVHQFGPLAQVKALLEGTEMGKVFPDLYVAWPSKPSRWRNIFKASTPDTKPASTAAGTEHWITIHPHGEDEKGIPVLVRENGDGTASVIGGAGHHLDQLRIGEKGRIGGAKAKGKSEAWDPGAVSEEQANTAREQKAQSQQLLREAQDRVAEHVKNLINDRGAMVAGEQVKWDDLSSAEQKKLIQNATKDSLYQSTYGAFADEQRAEAPVGPIMVTPAPHEPGEDNFDTMPDDTEPKIEGEDEPSDYDLKEPKEPVRRPRLALSTSEADAIYEEVATASALREPSDTT
jgi:hypothetical protein